MAQWEDDLREVVDEDGVALLRFAAVVSGTTDEAHRLVGDALTAAFRRGSPRGTSPARAGAVTVRTDDLGVLVADPVRRAVVGAQAFRDPRLWDGPAVLARVSAEGRACLVLRDDGRDAAAIAATLGAAPSEVADWLTAADDALSEAATTPWRALDAVGPLDASGLADAVAGRVREARGQARRTRRRVLATGAAALVAVAAVAGAALYPGGGKDGAAPSPTTTPSDAAFADQWAPIGCGQSVAADPALAARMTLDSGTPRIVAAGAWWGSYSWDDDALTAKERGLADPDDLTVAAVLTRDGVVVAQGVDDGSGAVTMDPATGEISSGSVGIGTMPASTFADYADGGSFPVTFAPCSGALGVGSYDVRVVATTSDDQHWYVSNAAPVTVIAEVPTGYQPPWLKGSVLACGERVDEFEARAALRPLSTLDESVVVVEDHDVIYSFKNPAKRAVSVMVPPQMGIAWIKDGRVVGVSPQEQPDDKPTRVGAGKKVSVRSAPWDATDYCRPSATGTYPHRLPAGTYQVVGYGRFYSSEDPVRGEVAQGGWATELSGPGKVIVAQDGSVSLG